MVTLRAYVKLPEGTAVQLGFFWIYAEIGDAILNVNELAS